MFYLGFIAEFVDTFVSVNYSMIC